MPLVDVLLALLTVFVAFLIPLIGGIYRLGVTRILPKLQTISEALFGRPDDDGDNGLVSDIRELDTKLQRIESDREDEHREVKQDITRLRQQLRDLAQALRRSDAVDIDVSIGDNNNRHDHDDD